MNTEQQLGRTDDIRPLIMWQLLTYIALIVSQQCFGRLKINTVDNYSELERTEAILSETISTVFPETTSVDFVASRNETEENATKPKTGTITNETSGKMINDSTKSKDDMLTQSSAVNAYEDSLNATNKTYNNSEEAMFFSTDQNFNHSIPNTNTEDNVNDTNDQMRPRACPRRRIDQSYGAYIYWCALHGYKTIRTFELFPRNPNLNTHLQNDTGEELLGNQTREEKKKEEKKRYNYNISQQMWKYIPPIIIVLGTVGNILSILVMLRKRFRRTTMCFYLIALAIADMLVLYCSLLPKSLERYLSTRFLRHSDFLCKTWNFLIIYVSHIAPWIIVCLTSERFVAVIFPHYCQVLFTQARAAVALAFAILILLIFDLHYFWTHHLSTMIGEAGTTKVCGMYIMQHYNFMVNIWPWVDMALFSLVPIALIIVGNISICIKLGLAHYNRRNLGASTNQSRNQSKLISTTIILVSISLLFIVSTLPVTIWQIQAWIGIRDEDAWVEAQITIAAVGLLQYLNNACNFVLYCLSGKQFRKELITMFTRNRSHVHPTGGRQNNGDNVQMCQTTGNVMENSGQTYESNV